jgi:DNA-binding transcriptional regulator YdaS (Cro superfamily)
MTGDVHEGLSRARRAAGGGRALAKALGLSKSSVHGWRQVPEGRLFDVEAVTGISAEQLRPDLAGLIRLQRQAQRMQRARQQHAFAGARVRMKDGQGQEVVSARAIEVFDLGLIVAALQFSAQLYRMPTAAVLAAHSHEERAARAYGFALAFVVGRVSSTLIAGILGTTRQNVENAGERYLRARDGDDPEAVDGFGYVIERGKLRRPKDASEALWRQEQQFLDWFEGK